LFSAGAIETTACKEDQLMPEKQSHLIGVDTGGTFTDFAYLEGSEIRVLKVPSTRANPAAAVLAGLRKHGLPVWPLSHGSTVATNALLERRGAKTALVTTAGFEDLIEIGRQQRPELYSLVVRKPVPLVPRNLRFGVRDRVLPTGEIETAPDKKELDVLVATLKRHKVESIALCLLFSFVNPANEKTIAAHLRKNGFNVSVSHELLPEFREYERLSTTVINAYTSPVLERHIDTLLADEAVPALRIMISNGGSLPADVAKTAAVHTVLSGPAGGVIASRRIADITGHKRFISCDIGGTSTDVCLSTGDIPFTSSYACDGLPISVPVIDIHTIGAGGGSIARFYTGGALQVGPRSVGSDPGPACYGKCDVAALTDANLLTGRLPATGLLGGAMPLNMEAARRALGKLASQMRMTVEDFSEGVVSVADANIEQAIRLISVERGHDPRDFILVAFGGGGPVHAASLMARLGIPAALVPPNPGVFSACGLLFADAVRDYSHTVFKPTAGRSGEKFMRFFAPMRRSAEHDLARAEADKAKAIYAMSADMRYVGQSFELNVPMQKDLEGAFHRSHEHEYGYCDRNRPVEIVTVRLRVTVSGHAPQIAPRAEQAGMSARNAVSGRQRMRWNGKWHDATLYERGLLAPGSKLNGPAIVTEYSATTVVPPGFRCKVDGFENLILEKSR
jgi:N-methylhydantoinase A